MFSTLFYWTEIKRGFHNEILFTRNSTHVRANCVYTKYAGTRETNLTKSSFLEPEMCFFFLDLQQLTVHPRHAAIRISQYLLIQKTGQVCCAFLTFAPFP